jgi:hypothetical protein
MPGTSSTIPGAGNHLKCLAFIKELRELSEIGCLIGNKNVEASDFLTVLTFVSIPM